MPKFKMVGSFIIEVEAESYDEAYDLMEDTKLKDFTWDNVHDFMEIKDDGL